MSTRYAREMAAKDSDRIGGRRFVVHNRDGGRVLSEVLSASDGCITTMPGFWRGLHNRGFRLLELAGHQRRSILAFSQHRAHIIRRARELIADSATMRECAGPMQIGGAS